MISVFYTSLSDNKKTVIDPIVKSVSWSGDIMQAARTCKLELSNTLNGKNQKIKIESGGLIQLLYEDVEIFRGVIFSDNIKSTGAQSVTAYDENMYLLKNTDTIKLRNKTASTFIKEVCSTFGIQTGHVTNTDYVISKMIFKEKTLWDMFVTVLTETKNHTNRKFVITSSKGKLNLYERKEQLVKSVIENGVNLLNADYQKDINDMKTKVKVVGENDKSSTVQDDSLVAKFGMMQHYENAIQIKNESELNRLATERLKQKSVIDDEAKVYALGNIEVIAGKSVYVSESLTKIIGGYYVSTDEHKIEGKEHTMSLTLTATDELPTLEYEEE
ncbi:XkdQ/YqbQ family protein [Chengkuizengella axinellae]|uniref:YqbQ/XkdQ domain-containing protein n=1 Tax=Chengkuizengella axinellae TaxID=3064388 RepID=A0ABT9IW56_9BACL|nr:hypothetical protein [Chengkuizengella sp. 2205SS18-9]MDP5273552.1 hypothetical protein [Chengkuizengella sp. 2205SS18-9]